LEKTFDNSRVTRSKTVKGHERREEKNPDLQYPIGIPITEKPKIEANSRNGNSIKQGKAK